MTIVINHARGKVDMGHIRDLFTEYHEWLGVDLCFQGFGTEMKNLPGKYAEPQGCLLLAREEEEVIGGVGLWPLDEGVCEMKRLYVRPPWLGQGQGRKLAHAIIEQARERDYRRMCLDTLPQLTAALSLYRSLGFADTAPYYNNPIDGVSYLSLDLT
ncbi:MAG: GNAT family N-acetyltransferase [Rhodospirillaceae bacterium]|jgi:ribosomal protein S18 acetylase RimI-like enzyme|nr:GNAT family N-acetyltransferase [Rhodospirillaceae bacterium]MBT5245696.1 GNAT family N-acetyltransferase [Rhodospirillaceae bacterium]MBT5562361.1 GNAT family N-acetyltransferase [Rhodospirillaceae bacterium]MBT6241589.1 GNAT family N-acetyltransferase [Rhodospirillaceae bacterium]MBT7138810.1 GNAT family N-acetyltransferase [Rhodospirillaceae bacterium]